MELINELNYNGTIYKVNDILEMKYKTIKYTDLVKIIAIADSNYFLCQDRYNEIMVIKPNQIIQKIKEPINYKELTYYEPINFKKLPYKINKKKCLEMLIEFYEAEKDK